MQPLNIQQTITDISLARLSSYRNFFNTTDSHEIYGLYCWNEALSATLFRLISVTEIVLRNRFHSALSNHFHSTSSRGGSDANDWYNYLALPSKSDDKIKKVTHFWHKKQHRWVSRNNPPSANDVVSQMTLGFWPQLLNSNAPWGHLLPNIVPGHRYTSVQHWNNQKNQDSLYARIDTVNKMRNRIAHFEPIWKQGAMYEEKRKRQNKTVLTVTHPAPSTLEAAVNMIRLKHDRIAELLKWLSPDRETDYKNSYVKHHFTWLCSNEGLSTYRGLKSGIELPLSKFKRELNGIMKSGQMIRVKRSGIEQATLYPIRR